MAFQKKEGFMGPGKELLFNGVLEGCKGDLEF
jgi:hypothetical protein